MRSLHSHVTPRARLLARRSELLHRYQDASQHADEASAEREIEMIDSANDQWDVRVLSRLGDVEARQLTEVIAALWRLTSGTYGTCVRCGEKIAAARLEAVPEAAMCTDCASRTEHRER